MDIQIINTPFSKELYGFSGLVADHQYATVGRSLMGRMWSTVKEGNLKHDGVNVWVYGPGESLFTGVHLLEPPEQSSLEYRHVQLTYYARYTHTGPYRLLGVVVREFMAEIAARGLKTGWPYLEVYGHCPPDEAEAVTDVLVALV